MIVIIVLIGTVVLANSYETFEDRTSLNIVLVIFAIFVLIVIIIVGITSAITSVLSSPSNNFLKLNNSTINNIIKNMPAANNKRSE